MSAPLERDRIELRGLRAFGYHGVFDRERRNGQEFIVDLTVQTDFTEAIVTDDVAATVDYGQLADTAAAIVRGEPRDLIETVAAEIADAIVADSRVAAVEVVVHKPSAPVPHSFADVRVATRRYRDRIDP